MDSALAEPSSARVALRRPTPSPSSYDSQYIRDYALAARGAQAIVFGDLSVALDAGRRLVDSPTRAIQVHGISHLTRAGLLCRDDAAVHAALDAAKRAAARQVPGATEEIDVATACSVCSEATSSSVVPQLMFNDPWLAARDCIDRGDISAARSAIASLPAGGTTCEAMAHALAGLVDDNEGHWHEALRLADQHGLRLIAVDALEAVAAAAAAATASPRRSDCCGRGRTAPRRDRLRVALARGAAHLRRRTPHRRDGLGEAADQAWDEGLTARMARGRRVRRTGAGRAGPADHGWASLTPTEQRVVDLVAEGLTNPEIAERLLMARGTVKTHLEHVFAKTGYRNRGRTRGGRLETPGGAQPSRRLTGRAHCEGVGGGSGIRTHGGLPHTRFPSVPIRPLSHPS